jgi:hypothetical protein
MIPGAVSGVILAVVPVLAFHPSDILAGAAVLGVWIILRRLRRGRRRRDG